MRSAGDLLARNPADLVDPPKPARRVLTTWTAEQLRTFLAGVAEDRLAALYQLAAASGMRIGELVGLEWPDVHLDGGYLDHGRAFTRPGGEPLNPDAVSIQFKRRAARSACRRSSSTICAWLGDDGTDCERLDVVEVYGPPG